MGNIKARALIDPASEASFVTDRLRRTAQLPAKAIQAHVSGVNGGRSTPASRLCSFTIGSLVDPVFTLPIDANLPAASLPSSLPDQIPSMALADATFWRSGPVDLLIGADVYPSLLRDGSPIKLLEGLVAQNTGLGWIITGPVR